MRKLNWAVLFTSAAISLTLLVHYIFQLTPLVVTNGSMGNAVPLGSVVVIKPLEEASNYEGKIVVFTHKGTNVLHRIVGQNHSRTTFLTKGDANSSMDTAPVTRERIWGEYSYHIPYLGHLVHWIQFNSILVLTAILILFIRSILSQRMRKKSK